MQFSRNEFVESFVSEVQEQLDTVDAQILQLKNSPLNQSLIKEILRGLHTVKGSARMLDFLNIEQLSHALEDVFKGLDSGKFALNNSILNVSLTCVDRLQTAVHKIETDGNDEIDITVFKETCEKINAEQFFTIEDIEAKLREEELLSEKKLESNGKEHSDISTIKSVRTDLAVIDDIVHTFDDLIVRFFRYRRQLETFEKEVLVQTESQAKELPKQFKEELTQYENSLFNLQHDLIGLRMLPLSIILNPLKVEIEKDAVMLGKDVSINIPDSDTLMDKFILENLKTVLIQLVRNGLMHGIESKEERKAKGKSEKGNISITFTKIQNRMLISVSDDGRGLDYEKIKKRALSMLKEKKGRKMIQNTEEEIKKMPPSELQQFLFVNGFSTSETATELSGRGIGLDIVRSDMEKIKGKIKVVSTKGAGTTFELNLPLSLATQQGIFITSGELKFMLPSHYISEILDCSENNTTTIQNQTYVKLHGENLPLYFLSSILNVKTKNILHSVVIAEYIDTKIALAVDSVEQYENVMVNPMPKILQKVSAFQGMIFDDHYAIIPILDVPFLMKKLKNQLSYEIKKFETLNTVKRKRLLIVDDSSTTRHIFQSIFNTSAYECETATDGIDALNILRDKHFDLIITDINMPKMDGLLLIKNIRITENPKHRIPIIVVTGAYGKYDKNKFIDAGADAYMTKLEFSRIKLINMVKDLLD